MKLKGSELTRREYEQIAEDFYRMNGNNIAQQFAIYPTFLSIIGECPTAKIIDLGCGSGYSTRGIQYFCDPSSIEGVDFSEGQINLARKNSIGRNINYSIGDLTNPKLAKIIGKRFDLATAAFLFHYSSTLKDLRNMIRNIEDLLYPKSIFVGIIPNPNVGIAYHNYGIRFEPTEQGIFEGAPYRVTLVGAATSTTFTNHWWSLRTYRQIFEERGFELNILPCLPTKEAIKKFGKRFWQDYIERPSSLILHATKT